MSLPIFTSPEYTVNPHFLISDPEDWSYGLSIGYIFKDLILSTNFLFLELIHRSLNSQRISFLSLVKNCNHKGLGIYYLLSHFIFGISGTLISVLIRIELYSSGNRIISPENQNFYNISITLHGFLMIFFLVMPGLFGGFGNHFVPIFQGSPEVVYPRVNNFSILILSLSYLFLILSLPVPSIRLTLIF